MFSLSLGFERSQCCVSITCLSSDSSVVAQVQVALVFISLLAFGTWRIVFSFFLFLPPSHPSSLPTFLLSYLTQLKFSWFAKLLKLEHLVIFGMKSTNSFIRIFPQLSLDLHYKAIAPYWYIWSPHFAVCFRLWKLTGIFFLLMCCLFLKLYLTVSVNTCLNVCIVNICSQITWSLDKF